MNDLGHYRERKKGIIGTVVFHTIVLLLLIFLGFFTPLPLPGEEGILVNFGDSESGLGDREPSPARRKKQTPPPQQQQEKEVKSVAAQATTPPVKRTKPQPAKQVAMTQDYEKTVAINAADKKKQLEEKRRKEELNEKQRKAEAEKKRLAEIERKRLAELEKERKAAAEQVAKEEAERKRKAEEQRKIDAINSRTAGAFSKKSGSGTGGTGSSTGKSQGKTFPGGNQGVPTGDSNASKYGQGGSGTGNQGAGVSFSLAGRSAKSLPKPKYPGNDEGTVVVKVIVDKYGNVTSAEPGVRGTTIANGAFWNEAKKAALKAKFNVDEKAPAFQQGTISYRFTLD